MILSKIKSAVWHFIPGPVRVIYRKRHFDENNIIYKEMSFLQYKEQAFCDFLPNATMEQKSAVGSDMLDAYIEHNVRPDEYMLFKFAEQDRVSRSAYLPQLGKDLLVSSYYRTQGYNASDIIGFLRKKSAFYEYLKDFFKREALLVSSMDDLSVFIDFCQRHPHFIAKDDTGGCGVGVKIMDVSEISDYTSALGELVGQGSWILEELIQQHPALAEFNPTSVNTVRLPSFRHGNKVVPAYPLFRFGRSGAIVDNASQGGLFVSLDVHTGTIITDAFDEHGHQFVNHPNFGIKFKGNVIPQWMELIRFAKEIHLSLPVEQVYVAFDFALTPQGWVLVEGNWGDMIMMEISLQKGLFKEFKSLLYGKDI